MTDFKIAKATYEEMDFFLSHAREEGWNPGLHDALPFFQTDPYGFFFGTLDGVKIGCISAVAYNSDFGFIGFYIVIPAYRKRGFGLQLWAHGLNYLGTRTVGLDGVLKEQKNYEHSDFRLYYKNHRFEKIDGGGQHSKELLCLKEVPFEVLLSYDLSIVGFNRAVFLKHWIEMPNAYSLAKMQDGRLQGYGVLRRCYEGYKVGPLFAESMDIAEEIFHALCAKSSGGPVFLDVPEINPQALQMVKALNLKSDFETVRMYNKTPPKQQLDKIFGVTTFELG